MQKEPMSPMCLEQLLQVPLQVIRLEDILREKSSSVSPSSGVHRDDDEKARLCRSVDSHPLTKNNSGDDRSNDELHKKYVSAPCLFTCCTKGTLFTKTKFETKSLTLPDGSKAVVPVAQNGESEIISSKLNQLQYYNEILRSSENSFLRNKAEVIVSQSANHLPTVLPSPKSPPLPSPILSPLTNTRNSISPQQVTVRNTLSQSIMPVVLGKVTDKPTRYEDLLLTRHTYSSYRAGSISPSRKNQNGREDRESNKNTLELTSYNDGRKGPAKEYRCGSDVRYFENQHLQLSRVVRDRSQVLQQPRIQNFVNKPHDNDNTLDTFMTLNYGGVNSASSSSSIAHPQLKPTSSNVKNITNYNNANNSTTNKNNNLVNNHTNKTINNGSAWNELQISRCQKDEHAVIPMDGHRNAASGIHPNPMPVDGEEGEITVDGDLQNYLTDYRFMKQAKKGETGSESNDGNDQDKNKISVRYIIEQATAAAEQDQPPSPPPAAQITRVSNVSIHPIHSQSASRPMDAWSERTIARVPLRHSIRKNSAFDPKSQSTSSLIPTTIAPQNFHSPPKRLRSSMTTDGRSQTDMLLARQHYQQQAQHTYVPRYPSQTSTNTSSKATNHIDQYNSGRNASSTMPYNNSNQQLIPYQQQHQSAYMHGVSTQHSSQNHLQPQPQHISQPFQSSLTPSQQHHFQKAVLVAAAAAANAGEPFDAVAYSERLLYISELYGHQELHWETLNDFYQKFFVNPWDPEFLKQWKNQHLHNQSNGPHNLDQQNQNPMIHDEGNYDYDTMSQHQQHQLALRAMNAANTSTSNFAGGKVQYIAPRSPITAASSHHKTAMMNLSSSTQPALPLQIQNKYNHNSQQLHQLQQIHQRQYQIQQQLRYRGPTPKHQQQQKAHHAMLKANYEMNNSAHYRNAYQLPTAAASSSTSPALLSPNSTRPNVTATSGSGERNYHSPAITMMVAGDARPANTLQDEIHYPVSIHRQALESVMKNNYRNGSTNRIKTPEVPTYLGMSNTDHRNISHRNQGQISATPTTPQIPLSLQWPHWSRTEEQLRGENDAETNNMTAKESYKACLSHAASVIRRADNSYQSSPLGPSLGRGRRRLSIMGNNLDRLGQDESNNLRNDIIRPVPLLPQNTNQDQYSQRLSHDGRNDPEHEVLPKRPSFDEIVRNSKQNMATCSPVPLITGVREEVVTSVSPSAVLSGRDSPPEDDSSMVDQVDLRERDRDDSVGSGAPGNGTWQYDHVMLLDKRIKTYMCKKCFETLKSEQEIRNHLFCKMLANHVQCHVCLQIITSDAYAAHLQVHGVKPPDTAQFDN